jgi:AraC-like DNA-binding protein
MKYQEITPGARLKHYVKCYYSYESASDDAFNDTVFPSGSMEIIFNLGSGNWQIVSSEGFDTTPSVELWGQITKPLAVRSIGKNTMLGVRLFPHAAACFVNDNVEQFNNAVIDFKYLGGKSVASLHQKLLEIHSWDERIQLLENFLIDRLSICAKTSTRINVVHEVMRELKRDGFFDNIENVASRYGITARYLQKLFLQYTGLTPKLFSKINRFQNSLILVTKNEASLTDIAYDCGYFDQSHFIRDFKSFTGLTPSGYSSERSPITFAFAGKGAD